MEITKEWLETIFQRDTLERSVTKVTKVQSSAAVGKGENFFSEMTRFKLELILGSGKKVKKSILVKQMPMTEGRKAMITDLGSYFREIMVYRDIFTSMEDVLSEFNDMDEPLWGRCIDYRPYDRLILEDLTDYGYKMANKLLGLDLEHCKLALSKIAKFHALSVVLKERSLISLDNFGYNSFYMVNQKKDNKLHNLLLTKLIETCEEHYGPEWKPLFEKLGKRALGKSDELFAPSNKRDESKFAVLIHGDFWTNNMLFKYDDDLKPSAVRFVDYQTSFYQSPAQDISYFFATSPSIEVRKSHLDELVVYYHQRLEKYMKKYNCTTEIPTLDYIKDEMNRFAPFGLGAMIFVVPYMSVERPDDIPDLEDVMKNMGESGESAGETIPSVFLDSKPYHEKLKVVLKKAEQTGLI